VADSNVRERVTDHVRSLLDADADAFETAADLGEPEAGGDEVPGEREADEDGAADGPDAQVTMEDYL
jgi:hypothetical protein